METSYWARNFYLGTFAADQHPKHVPRDRAWGLIVNNQPAHKPGEHWVVVYGSMDGEVHMFDTAGRHPKDIYRPWVQWMVDKLRKAPIRYNKHKAQPPFTSVLGFHCLHYLWLRKKENQKSPLHACSGRTSIDSHSAQVWNDRAVIDWAMDHNVPVMFRDF